MKTLPADLVIRSQQLCVALNISDRALTRHVRDGRVPRPDGLGSCRTQVWTLETIRAWNPAVAKTLERLMKVPGFAPRDIRRPGPVPVKKAA